LRQTTTDVECKSSVNVKVMNPVIMSRRPVTAR
jgi:hypothetical protein